MTDIDFTARYRVERYDGIAFMLKSFYEYEDEDYEWTGIKCEDTERVVAVMVGDDRAHIVYVDELTRLDDDEYCPECGQIGCGHYRDSDESTQAAHDLYSL